MALRAPGRFGVLHRDSTILGVGAGSEPTIFHLTRLVRLVFARDRGLSICPNTPGRDRTCDLWFRKPSLYPLSYGGHRGTESGNRGAQGARPPDSRR
jgi:hypothetical protein